MDGVCCPIFRRGFSEEDSLQNDIISFKISTGVIKVLNRKPPGEVLHYGVRRGCAPVLDSFWIVFGLKILGLGYTFTGKFL